MFREPYVNTGREAYYCRCCVLVNDDRHVVESYT